jgi:predicted nucleic-acid-binding protein
MKNSMAVEVMSSLSIAEPGWVGIPVIVDLVWELTHTHKVKRAGVVTILNKLLSCQEIIVEKNEIVRQSVDLYDGAKIEFADCLIACSAKAAGCSKTMTFDRRAARDAGGAGMELLG